MISEALSQKTGAGGSDSGGIVGCLEGAQLWWSGIR